MLGPHEWHSTKKFFKAEFSANMVGSKAKADQMRDEKRWLYRFFKTENLLGRGTRVRFGADNPKSGESKEPDFVVELNSSKRKRTLGIEMVSAYSTDAGKKTSVNPASTLYQKEEEWAASPDQWVEAFKCAVESKFQKHYSKLNLDSLALIVCDETNSKDSLFNGHQYIKGHCYYLRYISGSEFARATSIRRSADGILTQNSAGFDSVSVLTRKPDSNMWISIPLYLNEEREKLRAWMCQKHPHKTISSAFGEVPFNGPNLERHPADYSREAANLWLKAQDAIR